MLKSLVNNLSKSNLRESLFLYVGIAILAIPTILIPLFSSGFIGDDTLSSLVQATLQLNKETVLGQYIENFNVMKTSRITLLQPYYFLFLIIGGEILYLKIWVSVIVISLIVSIYHFNKYFKLGAVNSIIAMLAFIALLQFRDYGDPVLAFYGITPLSILCLLWAVIFLRELFNQNNSIYKILGINLIIIFSGQLYEFNIVILAFTFLTFILTIKCNILNVIKKLIPSIIFFTIFFSASIYFRFFSEIINQEYQSAYSPSLNILVIFKTTAIQLISSLPFTNFIFDKITYNFQIIQIIIGILLAVVFFVISIMIKRNSLRFKNDQENLEGISSNYNFGLLLIIFWIVFIPTLLISLSPKYQSETSFGNPYTNSLYFIVGLSLLIGYFLSYFRKTFYVVCLILATSYGFNYVGNQDIVNKINVFWDNPRSTAVAAMKNGILSDLAPDSIVLTSINYPWSIAPFYKQYSNVSLNQLFYQGAPGMIFSPRKNIINPLSGVKHNPLGLESDFLDDFPHLKKHSKFFDGNFYHFDFNSNDSKFYFFNYVNNDKDSGVVSICRIKQLVANQNDFASVLCDEFSIFIKHKKHIKNHINNLVINVDAYDSKGGKLIGHFEVDSSSFLVSKFKDGSLLKYRNKEKNVLVDGKSINLKSDNPWINKSIVLKRDFFKKIQSEGVDFQKSSLLLSPVSDNVSTHISVQFSLGQSLNAFQPEFSHIIGNHPGAGFQGFVFQKVFSTKNIYEFTYGNGSEWKSLGKITIDNLDQHALDVNISKNQIAVFFDNKKMGSGDDYINSGLQVQVGGLQAGGRNFVGKFYGVLVTQR